MVQLLLQVPSVVKDGAHCIIVGGNPAKEIKKAFF